ncbi:hypothetical protein [Turicibacter sanguinis]|uniref:hypothetical protein n=1 Tax=Turicibacter sanguinis TaxID=154288 RepID=UPI00399A62B2
MRYQNDQVINWALNTIKREYAEDVSLLLLYGSYENGTSNDLSDVDLYFIPKTERAYELSQTFIIKDIGYDLFPMSWHRVEEIADFNDRLTPCVGDVKILYANSIEDERRFKHLQLKLHKHLSDRAFMLSKAKQQLTKAKKTMGELILANSTCESRLHAASIICQLSDCVAFFNQTYFHRGLKTQVEDLKQMRKLPLHFLELYDFIVTTTSNRDLQLACMALIKSTEFLLKQQDNQKQDLDYEKLIGRYEELCSSFNKIYTQCQLQNAALVYLSAAQVQVELNEITEDFHFPRFDLLCYFDASNLENFSIETFKIENQFITTLKEHSIPIRSFATIETFLETQ